MDLPPDFRQRIAAVFPSGAAWLERLPDLISLAARRWGLEVGSALSPLSYNYLAPARRRDGSECVLKIGVPNPELTSEIAALRLYDGEGACRLYEADEENGLLLLERLRPGGMLHQHGTDRQQTAIAARLMRQLHRPAPRQHALISLRAWFDALTALRPRFAGGTGPFPPRLVEACQSLLPDLFAGSPSVLLHGDCHHFNILSSARGWLVVDPKGVVGPAGYEPAPFLINPLGEFARRPHAARLAADRIRIFSDLLFIDARIIQDWAICHALLSAWWDLDESPAPSASTLACAEIFLDLKP
jgi:streptomycin 6-kinase